MKRILLHACCLLLLVTAQKASAQLQVGDDMNMRMNGSLTVGYDAQNGNSIPSDHSLVLGADATLSGDYYNPNFLNYTITPYYNRSAANSSFSSLTNSSGVSANVNLFRWQSLPGVCELPVLI